MVKQLIGVAVMAFLIVVAIIGFMDDNTSETSTSNTDSGNAQGAGIVAPGQSSIEVGKMAPDFKVETLSGDTFQLSDLRGKKVILNFWASWCGPCKKEMPEMQKFHEKYGDKVEVIAVNLTDSETGGGVKKVRNYIDKYGYTYPVPLDKKGKVKELYNVAGVPSTYFIGTDGKVQQPPKLGPMTYEYMVEMANKLD
ncbi:redoxin domain-containing protein [Virgibacillus doumboii]|uniref:redoxin domain-containing protein n=1 Tax=Virgibacillus doumboii TaxID=2697503 RepID=UPI0013DF6EFD|nr:redoxin domain-containing protein [Virgibacillus doumboii]